MRAPIQIRAVSFDDLFPHFTSNPRKQSCSDSSLPSACLQPAVSILKYFHSSFLRPFHLSTSLLSNALKLFSPSVSLMRRQGSLAAKKKIKIRKKDQHQISSHPHEALLGLNMSCINTVAFK